MDLHVQQLGSLYSFLIQFQTDCACTVNVKQLLPKQPPWWWFSWGLFLLKLVASWDSKNSSPGECWNMQVLKQSEKRLSDEVPHVVCFWCFTQSRAGLHNLIYQARHMPEPIVAFSRRIPWCCSPVYVERSGGLLSCQEAVFCLIDCSRQAWCRNNSLEFKWSKTFNRLIWFITVTDQ